MKELVFLFILCLEKVLSLSAATDDHPYCNKDSCPKYNIIRNYGQLELRCYHPSIWVSISGQGKLFVEDHKLPMWKLTQFINGNNTKGIKVPIGTVTSRLFDESRRIYSAEYYIPGYFWDSMPREVDPSVRVVYRTHFCVYVYGFYGWLHSFETLTHYRTMTKSLIKMYRNVDDYYPNFFLYMNYRSGILPSYNEIWYVLRFDYNKDGKSLNNKV